MRYDIDLFAQIIDFIVKHDDEPELYLRMKDGTEVDFVCYNEWIDAYIEERDFKFKNIIDFLDNMYINNVSLRQCWNEIEYIDDDCGCIDWTKTPTEQFQVIDGRISYVPKR